MIFFGDKSVNKIIVIVLSNTGSTELGMIGWQISSLESVTNFKYPEYGDRPKS